MTKFFDKDLADNVGYGTVIQVAAIAADLHADIACMNAMRKAEGRPTLEEEEEADRAEFKKMLDEGYELDPDVAAWARGE